MKYCIENRNLLLAYILLTIFCTQCNKISLKSNVNKQSSITSNINNETGTPQPLIDDAFPLSTVNADSSAHFIYNDTIATFDNTRWYPKWDEANVFKVQLEHNQTSNPYTLRIGKGGQLYSIMTPIGEIAPYQNQDHAWVDDTYLLVSYQYDLIQPNSNGIDGLTPFIHQCGMYPQIDYDFQQGHQFWAPIVASKWDPDDNAYSTISLGMISNGPSYNRGDVLMYQKTRDIGNGVFEITYMAYNYNTSYTASAYNYVTDLCGWGGVRTTSLPDLLLSNINQTWSLTNQQYADAGTVVEAPQTGGWVVATANSQADTSYALGLVFGNQNPASTEKLFSFGTTGRNFTVQAVTYREPIPPGTIFYFSQYYVLGKLSEVIDKCNSYSSYPTSGFLTFNQNSAPTIPLYLTNNNGQTILSETGSTPAFYVYSVPVANSKPLYLIYDHQTNHYHATCDPYNTMPRYPVLNDPEGRAGVRPYDGTTDIIKLYGFVMPSASADSSFNYQPINRILADTTFFTGHGLYDSTIVVRISN